MSIRLRLTLLFSSILAVTLLAFGFMLYLTQSQLTFNGIKLALAHQAQEFSLRERRFPRRPDNTPGLTIIPGRWMQTRDGDGAITARSPDLGENSLPLSAAGLAAVKAGDAWSETTEVENEPLLIYSQPVTSDGRVTQIIQVASPITERAQSLGTLRLILGIGGGLAILLAVAMGWLLAGMALRPIHRITDTAQAIGAERDFARRVEHRGPNDEVGQLATTFNAMLTELETAYRQLENALQTQQRFVADASHELRTPLTTIRGNIELLQREPPLDLTDRADALADTREEVDRLIRLVNQLLALARSDAGLTLQTGPVALKPLVEDICRQAKNRAPSRAITYEIPDVQVRADRDALFQVLLILTDNVLMHTPPNAALSLSARVEDEQVWLRVQDTGPGIPPRVLPHIFERFYRARVSRSGPGTGLGLAIAKELIEAQGGSITAESRVGSGTTLALRLPVMPGTSASDVVLRSPDAAPAVPPLA